MTHRLKLVIRPGFEIRISQRRAGSNLLTTKGQHSCCAHHRRALLVLGIDQCGKSNDDNHPQQRFIFGLTTLDTFPPDSPLNHRGRPQHQIPSSVVLQFPVRSMDPGGRYSSNEETKPGLVLDLLIQDL